MIAKSPIPVALDESLIGVYGGERSTLLDTLNPHFIVLKPSLLGGFKACEEWIKLADKRNIGWWITSALETNIGLNAIYDFTRGYEVNMYQGLGTGQIYENNIPSPLAIVNSYLVESEKGEWDLNVIENG